MTKSSFPILDMMINMQRLSLDAMSVYQPFMSAFLQTERDSRPASLTAARGRPAERRGVQTANEEQVIGIGEEVLNVGTRTIPGKTTRIRRVVVQKPVQQDVTLHTETVVLERRKPLAASGNDILTEVTIEMSDLNEVPVVSKSVHLVEEVLLRKEITARTETIHDTVRRDSLEIDQPSNLPVVFNPAQKQDESRRAESGANEPQDKRQSISSPQVGNKPADQKRP